MADQNLVAIHDVSFLVVQLSYYIELINLQLLNKVSFLVHFDYFSSQAWFFCIFCRRFKSIHQKLKSPNVYEMWSTG